MSTQFTDEQLQTLGELYCRNPALRLSGFTFIQFAHYPADCLRLFVFNAEQPRPDDDTEIEFLPPLPAQVKAAKKISERFQVQDAVTGLHLDEDLQHDYPEAGHQGNRVCAPIHRRKPPRRYKVGSHKARRAAAS